MYEVSGSYLDALKSKTRTDSISGHVRLANGGSISISDENIVRDSVKITKELCGSTYRIGTFGVACLQITFIDRNDAIRDYSGAEIELTYRLRSGGGQSVPLGRFIADGSATKRRKNAVTLTAYDYGVKFDEVPSDEIRTMTAAPFGLLTAVCEQCGVDLATEESLILQMPNGDTEFSPSSPQIQSCRDLVMWCADVLCGYAVIDRSGALRIISAKYSVDSGNSSNITTARDVTEKERRSISVSDTRSYIKYLTGYSGGKVKNYTSGHTDSDVQAFPAAYEMRSNPLLSGKSEEECDSINERWLAFIDSFKQRSVTAELYGDPAIDIGDALRFSGGDVDQRRSIVGVVTGIEWRYRRYTVLTCRAAPVCGSPAPLSASSRTSVKKQSEKRMDAMTGSGGGSGSSIGKDLGEKNVSFNDLANNSVEREAHLNAIFGERNKVGNGVCNIVGGSHNYVNTSYSLAIGEFLNVSDEASQIVCGVYNAPQGGARFVVGNGSGEGSRSNAAWISSGGDMTLMGSLHAQDAVCEGLGTFRRGLNIPLGDGIRTVDVFEGEVLKSKLTLKLGDGMEFSPDPDFPDNSKLLTLNIGEGLEFTAEEAAEGESAPEESKKLSLKRATVNNIGGIQLGEGLSLNNVTGKTDIMQASSTRLGGIKLGEGLVRNTETGGTDIRRANGAQLGGIILGSGLAYNNETGKTDLAKATGGQLGGIILGEGLELNSETGKVDVTGGGGLTVENAVIIQEANAHYILHNYTVVDYIDGNKVCYAGPQNQIIVNGYVFNKNSADLSDIGRAMYPAARFGKAGTSTSNMISNVDFYFDIVSVIPEYATIWAKTAPEFYWYTSALNTFDLSRTGIAFTWDAFYPPCDGHPYGFVYGLPRICYVSDADGTFVSTAMYGRCYFDFASEAEYNAAIRLTYEPNTLRRVTDSGA